MGLHGHFSEDGRTAHGREGQTAFEHRRSLPVTQDRELLSFGSTTPTTAAPRLIQWETQPQGCGPVLQDPCNNQLAHAVSYVPSNAVFVPDASPRRSFGGCVPARATSL